LPSAVAFAAEEQQHKFTAKNDREWGSTLQKY
jgi:hypothetical protein